MKVIASELFFVVFSILMLAQIQTWDFVGESKGLSPAAWPKMILYGILIFSFYRIFAKKTGKVKEIVNTGNFTLRVLSVIVLIGSYIVGMLYFGFVISTLLFQWLLLWFVGFKKKVLFVLSPILVTTVIYLIFVKMMYVPLPRGEGVFRALSYFFY